jgi:hypothetical protein
MSEMITNEDGMEKQDCERKALKRWLAGHQEEYKWLKPTILGGRFILKLPDLQGDIGCPDGLYLDLQACLVPVAH